VEIDRGGNVDATTGKSTAEGALTPAQHVTDEEAESFDIEKHLATFMFEEPFYSYILRSLDRKKTTAVPTAGVIADVKSRRFKLYWNPRFLAGLTPQEIRGLLIHEALHLVFEHTTTRVKEPHTVWNWATDLAINSCIPKDMLPKGGLIPGEPFAALEPDVLAKMTPERIERYEKLSAIIASLPKLESAEWYYEKLMEDPETQEMLQQEQGAGQHVKPGDLQVDENGNLVDKDGNPVSVVPGTTDSHDGWGGTGDGGDDEEPASAEVREAMAKQVEEWTKKAITEADKRGGSKGWGSMPSDMRDTLRKMFSDQISWKSVLKRFVGFARSYDRQTSWRRIHRRAPGLTPGPKRSYTARLAVYVDQSGSVGDDDLSLLMGELSNLARHAQFDLYPFDTAVDEANMKTYKKGKRVGFDRTRCGGTDFTAPTLHANKNKKKYDGYLILTDGECYKPKVTNRVRRGWVIVPNRELMFEPDRQDFVIKLTPDT
jgi:predicted metal-dependent peptidase